MALPLGRRATLDLFARLLVIEPYSSRGLDLWNGVSPPAHVKGRTLQALHAGGGIRFGRWP